MAYHSDIAPAGPSSLRGLAQQIMERFAAAKTRRGGRAAQAQLLHMEPRLLDDIGADREAPAAHEPIARLNPMVVAVNLYTVPRCGR
jgi:hypothetical protein